MARGGLVGRVLATLEETTGFAIVDADHLRVQEAVAREAYYLANDLEELGYVSLNSVSGRPNEPTQMARRRWAQQARVVWLADPVAGASVEMLNEFTLGRGVASPRFKDKEAQEIMDEAWGNEQNQRVLTSFLAQVRLGNSLSVQSNVFLLMFDDGDDGKVQLSFLPHDNVKDAMTDPEVGQRVLFYLATKRTQEWDWGTNAPKPSITPPRVYYYENWGALSEAITERGIDPDTADELIQRYRDAGAAARAKQKPEAQNGVEPINPGKPWKVPGAEDLEFPPPERLGEGKVYHLTDGNLDMEMIFGIPRMRRTLRWISSLNDFLKARVDMMNAAAAFIMTKKVNASPSQFEKLATKAMRATSDLRSTVETAISPDGVKIGPRPGSILAENAGVQFEPFKLDSGAGNAQVDAQALRGQISAGERWPQHYFGDSTTANLASSTSLELPILKRVDFRQELVEGVFRWFIDRVIERAVEVGRLDPNVSTQAEDGPELLRTRQDDAEDALATEGRVEEHDMLWKINRQHVWRKTRVVAHHDGSFEFRLVEYEDKSDDEEDTGRDLSYEFGMPSPLRRMMTDLVAAAVQTAQMADPNGTNVELTRVLLTLVFSEGFEMQDAADTVERIFPKGYDPMAALMAAQQGVAPGGGQVSMGTNFFGPNATDLPADPANAYGAPKTATLPENVPGAQEALLETETASDEPGTVFFGRHGEPIVLPNRHRGGQRAGMVAMRTTGRVAGIARSFDTEVRRETMDVLAELDMDRVGNGNGRGS